MDEERRKLLLAYAIATYDTTLTSAEALMVAGFPVGYHVVGDLRRTLRNHAHDWQLTVHGINGWDMTMLPLVVKEARDYCTAHQQEVDELERGLTATTESKE